MKHLIFIVASFCVVSAAFAASQWDIVYRTASGSGGMISGKISELTEESAPASGDWLLCEESGGALRKCDIGDLPGGSGGAQWYPVVLTNDVSPLVAEEKRSWIMPAAGSISGAHGYCDTVASGSAAVFDVEDEGTSIFTTGSEIEIEATERDSLDATDQPAIASSPHAFSAGDRLTFDIDSVPSGGGCLGAVVQLLITWD